MANASSIYTLGLISQTNPTVETAFGQLVGSPYAASTTTRATLVLPQYTTGPITAPTGTATAALVPSKFDGRPFRLRANFKVTGGTTTNFTGQIRFNSAANTNLTTFTGDNAIVSTGAIAVNSISASAFLEAICLWDSVSKQLAA